MDSVTVGFIRTQYDESSTTSAWDNPEYSNGRQDFLVYSIPDQRVVETKSLVRDVGSALEPLPVCYSKPWMLYGSLSLFNTENSRKIQLPGLFAAPGGISKNGRFVFYTTRDSTVVYDIQSNVFLYLRKLAGLFFVDDAGVYLLGATGRQIFKYSMASTDSELVTILPDSVYGVGHLTDLGMAVTLKHRPGIYSPVSALISGALDIRQIEGLNNQYLRPYDVDIVLSTGNYVLPAGSDIWIGNTRGLFPLVRFDQSRTL